MIVWFFDSWLGGKVVMEEFKKEFPMIEMILEMDRDNAPYGSRESTDIKELTKRWVEKLFARWADVVILACNTASVHALRWLQQEVFIGRHILWVTVPWAEAVVQWWYMRVGILATEATVRSRMYKERVHILDDSIHIEEIGAPWLVPLIEQGIISWRDIEILLEEYLMQFSSDIEALVLGCTHYPLIRESIGIVWNRVHKNKTPDIIDPGSEAAKKFKDWIDKKWLLDS